MLQLMRMTSLAWEISEEVLHAFTNLQQSEVTFDSSVLYGKKVR